MELIEMQNHPDTHDNVIKAQEFQPLPVTDIYPDMIHGEVDKLNELDASIKTAIKAAEQAEQHAKSAGEKSAGRGLFTDHKKAAIEELQTSGKMLAEAVQSGAKAQKISFEFQQRLAEISKYLFNLGVSNIVANNTVVRDLEMRMRGASEKELSELARQELTAVVKRLKEQQDILHKQAKTTAILEEHDSDIKNALQQAGDLKQIIANQSTQQAKLDSRQDKVISSLEDRAKAKEKLDASQDEFLKSLSAELSLLRDRLTTTENALQASQNASAALGKAHGSMRTITMAALAMSVSCLLAVAWLLLSH